MKIITTAILLGVTLLAVPLFSYFFGTALGPLEWKAMHTLLMIVAIVIAYSFIVGELTGNNSQVDKLWSLLPIIYTWVVASYGDFSIRLVVMSLLATLWGLRLTVNFAMKGAYSWRFWAGEEDYRWLVLRRKPEFNPRWKWTLFNLFFISGYQLVLILLFTLPAIVAPVDFLDTGKVSRTKEISSYPGGKGTNVARAFAALGGAVTATGFTAIAELEVMNDFLNHFGVTPALIGVKGTNRICLLITETVGKDETIINSESNLKINKKDIGSFLKKLKTLSNTSNITAFSGSLPVSLPQDFYQTAIEKIINTSTVLLDTSSKYLKYGIKACPHILKQNITELESAFEVKLSTDIELKKFVRSLARQYKTGMIIVTLNEKGSLFYVDGDFFSYPATKPEKFLSPVGSGDAFTAGLLYALERGHDPIEAGRWAVACATANLEHLGSCFISKRQVTRYLPHIKPF